MKALKKSLSITVKARMSTFQRAKNNLSVKKDE